MQARLPASSRGCWSSSFGHDRGRRAARRPGRAVARRARRRRAEDDRGRSSPPPRAGASRPRCSGGCRSSSTGSAPVPRPHLDRHGGACRVAARDGRDHRPPGAARVPRPAGDPAPPDVRAGPPVHVAVLHARLGAAAGHRRGAAGRPGQPGAGAARRVRGARRGRRDLAAGRRARGRERVAPHERLARHLFVLGTTAPPGQGAAGHRQRAALAATPARRVGAVVRADGRAQWVGRVWHALAWAVFGARLRRRRRLHGDRGSTPRPDRSCWCSSSAASSRSSSARPSASSPSCAASGWTSPGG